MDYYRKLDRDELYEFMGHTGLNREVILRDLLARRAEGESRKRAFSSKCIAEKQQGNISSDSNGSCLVPVEKVRHVPERELPGRREARRREPDGGHIYNGDVDDQLPGPSGSGHRDVPITSLEKRGQGSGRYSYKKTCETDVDNFPIRRFSDKERKLLEEELFRVRVREGCERNNKVQRVRNDPEPWRLESRRRRKELTCKDLRREDDCADSDSGISDGIASKPPDEDEFTSTRHRPRSGWNRPCSVRERRRDSGSSALKPSSDPRDEGDMYLERVNAWNNMNEKRLAGEERLLRDEPKVNKNKSREELLWKIMDEVDAEIEHQQAEEVQTDSPKKSSKRLSASDEVSKPSSQDPALPVYFCHYCATETYNTEGHEVHIMTPEHLRKVAMRKQKLLDELRYVRQQAEAELEENNVRIEDIECCDECLLPYSKDDFYHKHMHLHKAAVYLMHTRCDVCEKTLPNRWLYENHLVSFQHMKNDFCSRLAKGMDPEEHLLMPREHTFQSVGAQFVADAQVLYCRACDKMISGDASSSLHCMEKQHFDNVQIAVWLKQHKKALREHASHS